MICLVIARDYVNYLALPTAFLGIHPHTALVGVATLATACLGIVLGADDCGVGMVLGIHADLIGIHTFLGIHIGIHCPCAFIGVALLVIAICIIG